MVIVRHTAVPRPGCSHRSRITACGSAHPTPGSALPTAPHYFRKENEGSASIPSARGPEADSHLDRCDVVAWV